MAPLHPWEFPHKTWSPAYLDYVVLCERKLFLIIVDAYSKWLDRHPLNTVTSSITTGKLHCIFVEHGLPDQCVTDNVTYFTSSDFKEFMTNNGIKPITSALCHPMLSG